MEAALVSRKLSYQSAHDVSSRKIQRDYWVWGAPILQKQRTYATRTGIGWSKVGILRNVTLAKTAPLRDNCPF
jgi:hypothetical protein